MIYTSYERSLERKRNSFGSEVLSEIEEIDPRYFSFTK